MKEESGKETQGWIHECVCVGEGGGGGGGRCLLVFLSQVQKVIMVATYVRSWEPLCSYGFNIIMEGFPHHNVKSGYDIVQLDSAKSIFLMVCECKH